MASRGRELEAVKLQIRLDDDRLRRALTATVPGEAHAHISHAVSSLRSEVQELNSLRIVQTAQVEELEASNAHLEALVANLHGHGGGGGGPAAAASTSAAPYSLSTEYSPVPGCALTRRWIQQLEALAQLERARRAGLGEERRILRAELARTKGEVEAVLRSADAERARQQQSHRECERLQAALELGAGGQEAIHGLIDEVQELRRSAAPRSRSRSGTGGHSSSRASRGGGGSAGGGGGSSSRSHRHAASRELPSHGPERFR